MKKTIKSLLLLSIMAIILLALTGCGGNKLVATKSSDGDDIFGKYEEKIEISFKDDKANEIVWTMEFEEEENAETLAEFFDEYQDEMEGLEVKQKGKKVILTMDSKAFAEQEGLSEDDNSLSREEIKKSLEEDGYEVK